MQDQMQLGTTEKKTPVYPPVNLSEALVSLGNLRHNAREIKRQIGNKRRLMAVVKANAYGHNAGKVAPALLAEGIRDFGVANINEAIQLRKTLQVSSALEQKDCQILAFASPLAGQLPFYLQNNIDVTLTSFETAKQAELASAQAGRNLTVHLKIDTGMGRLGIQPADAFLLARYIDRSPYLTLKGIYTHFADSGEDLAFTKKQLQVYKQLVSEFEHEASRKVLKHTANSGAIISDKDTHLDMVRPGILLYGYTPATSLATSLELRRVMQFQSRVIFTKWLKKGASVSYGRRWVAPRKTRIATVSVGYADGYHRALSNKSHVCINGKFYPQIGSVTMDQIMIALGEDDSVQVGDRVVLFGWDGLAAAALAEQIGSIGYELLCAVSPRVKRVFID